MLDLILILTGLIGLIIATIVDIKKREVPDWINYNLIAVGLSLKLMQSIATASYYIIAYALASLAIMFIIANIFYHTKQWGGGDAKLLMAFGALYAPPFLGTKYPFLLILFISIFIAGAIYGIIYTTFLIFKNKSKFKQEFRIISKKLKLIKLIIASLTAISIIISFFTTNYLIKFAIPLAFILALLYTYLWIILKSVEHCHMYKRISPEKLTEGDWIARDIYHKDKLIYSRKSPGIEKKDIKKLIKYDIKSVLIKEGIPFAPAFLLGFILALIITVL